MDCFTPACSLYFVPRVAFEVLLLLFLACRLPDMSGQLTSSDLGNLHYREYNIEHNTSVIIVK